MKPKNRIDAKMPDNGGITRIYGFLTHEKEPRK